ncbi:MAG: hypothetical protein AAGA48_03140 [Myxococcota bacterium]
MIGLLLLAKAMGGDLDGRVAFDTLAATSRTEDPGAGVPQSSAMDVGIQARGELSELDGRLTIGVDYRGRVPVAGVFRNREQHLLFRAEAAWQSGPWEVGLGRFTVPNALWVSMDGVRATWRSKTLGITGFVGRRGLSTSRRNVPLNVFLPVVGGEIRATTKTISASLNGGLAGDRIELPGLTEDVQAGAVQAQVSVRASERTLLGASTSLANEANFLVGPNVGDLSLTVQALSLYRAQAFASWRMAPKIRLRTTFLHQQVAVAPDASLGLPLVDPSFTDLRVQTVLGNPAVGFVRPDVRFRARTERFELRFGVATEAHPPALRGAYGLARGWLEQRLDDPSFVQHVRWQIGAGFERGPGQIEAGVGMVDRTAGPVSSRSSTAAGLESEDLSPFVLEAQNVAFLRGFFTSRGWFGGLDMEANLLDRELRAFLQVGIIGRTSW